MNIPRPNQYDSSKGKDPLQRDDENQPISRPSIDISSTDPLGNTSPEIDGTTREQNNMMTDEPNPIQNQSMRSERNISTAPVLRDNLLSTEEVDELRTRWNAIQYQFVDSPCSAVEQGDALVADVITHLTTSFSNLQNSLNQLWLNHDDITTEELRNTLQNYRAVFDRLLNL
jgi:hypothetical protein